MRRHRKGSACPVPPCPWPLVPITAPQTPGSPCGCPALVPPSHAGRVTPKPSHVPSPGPPLSSGSKLAKCAKGGFGAALRLDLSVCNPSPFREAASRASFFFNPISTARNLPCRWPRGCQELPAPARLQPRLAAVFAGGGGVFALRQHLCEGRSPSGLRSGLHGARGIPSPVWGFLLVEAGSTGLFLGVGMGWDAATASPTL